MKTVRRKPSPRLGPSRRPGRSPLSLAPAGELAALRLRLAEADATLLAIRSGEVDAVMSTGQQGSQAFSLQGTEHAYRLLIEAMNEGALTLTTDKVILYANQCFARMVRCPLEQVVGGSFRRFLSAADRARLRPLMKHAVKSGAKIQMLIEAGDGSHLPVQISIRPLARDGFNRVTIGMVVTDMTEARRNEAMLRTLTHRLVQAQEAERGRVALELHDHITQLLCAILVRSQVLANQLSTHDGPAKADAVKLRELLGTAAEEVERISRDLRPSVLDELGLGAALRGACAEFAKRTGLAVKLAGTPLTARLPAEVELALYRIVQQALDNVEQHAQARHVTVRLRQPAGFVQVMIKDDGIGFDAGRRAGRSDSIGLLRMSERATSVGGVLTVKSLHRAGTAIEVSIPLAKVTN